VFKLFFYFTVHHVRISLFGNPLGLFPNIHGVLVLPKRGAHSKKNIFK